MHSYWGRIANSEYLDKAAPKRGRPVALWALGYTYTRWKVYGENTENIYVGRVQIETHLRAVRTQQYR